MVAIVPQTVPEPAVRSRQGNGTFTLGTRSAATETRTITYNATQGVRISRDPLKNAEMLEGANLYSYVRNNSIDSVDLNGLGQWNFGAVNNPGSVDNGDPLVTYTMDSTQRQCCKEATIYRFIPFGPDMTDQADNPDPTAVNWEPDD